MDTTPAAPAFDNKLGEGSFGQVYANYAGKKPCATKHLKLTFGEKDLPYIHESTLREYVVLAQCGGGYIPKLLNAAKFNVASDKLMLSMTHGGMNLMQFAKTMSYAERMHFVPSLIYQVASGLLQLKNSGILHGDVKPDNILIKGDTKKIRVIDFGITTFAQTQSEGQGCYIDHGTYVYCPYETFKNNQAYETSCVWNIAMSILDFLYKNYGGVQYFTEKYPHLANIPKKDYIYLKIKKIFEHLNQLSVTTSDSKMDITGIRAFDDLKIALPGIHSLINKMIDMNPTSRITLEQICQAPELLSVYKPPHIRLPKIRNTTSVTAPWKTNQDQREGQINSLTMTANMVKRQTSLPLAVLLMDIYLSKVNIAKEKLYLVGLSCLAIAACLSENCENLIDDLNSSIFRPYTLQDLLNMNVHIVQTLKGRVYYKTFVMELLDKYNGVVNYELVSRVMMLSSAPYDNEILAQRYNELN